MSLLYTISNICIPFSLMVFETAKRDIQGLKPSYGKWLALFLMTFFFNGLAILNIWWLTLIDLGFKCSLYFLPESVNDMIQSHIASLHLEGLIDSLRNFLINVMFWFYQKTMTFFLGKLRPEEAAQFREELGNSLSGQKVGRTSGVTVVPTIFQSTGISCNIINEESVAKTLIKRELQKKKKQFERRVSSDSRRSESSKKMKPEKESAQVIPRSIKMYENKRGGSKKQVGSALSPAAASSFNQLRQSSKILPEDFLDEEEFKRQDKGNRFSRQTDLESSRRSREKGNLYQKQTRENSRREQQMPVVKPTKKKEVEKKQGVKKQKKVERKFEDEKPLQRRNTDISDIKNSVKGIDMKRSVSPDSKEQIQMLQKLDVSASEYSDMFEEDRDEDLDEDEVKQVCRVQAIVEIGSAPNSKLEIYYLQLYSNGDLRIMSLYGRQFQKHELISMTKAPNSYFIMHLSKGTVPQRKIKFRGQYQPFMKYLQGK